ncbi:MAG: class I SAM-dependent methyltransferase [Bacteroidetes bacterium]|nr:class I SAM-dependent methyltransferase [Bacteroidota bacterium]
MMCKDCGLMTYSPRPETADIDAQYAYLDERQTPIGTRPFDENDRGTLRRIRRVHAFLASHLPPRTLRILDYGGSDGKLLVPFLRDDHDCEVVDYHPEPLKGIHRRGSTLEDIPQEMRYDVILCSHVLEHLSEPGELLRQLSARLTEGGLLYVEVPNEIWRGTPITYDPVTHVNFFNRVNIALLCQQKADLGIIATRTGREQFGAWRVKVTGILARKGAKRIEIPLPSALNATQRLQRPSLAAALAHLFEIRIPNKIARLRSEV